MTLPEHINGAIFDLDGTLLNSMWIWEDIDRRFLAKRGITVPPDYMHAVGAMQYRQAAEYTVARFGLREKPEALMTEWAEMSLGAYRDTLKLKPRAEECLRALHAQGVKLAVATSSTPEMCLPALERNGVAELFCAVKTTLEIGRGKAFPDVYLAAAESIGVEPSVCAVFEDSLVGLRTANSAGFYTVGVYDSHSHSVWETIKSEARQFISFDN